MQDKLRNDMKAAMKSGEKLRLETIRMLLSALRNEEISKMDSLSEEETLTVLQRECKRRTEAAEQFKQGGRNDLSEKEEQEADIIRSYMPEPLSEEELSGAVEIIIRETGARSKQQMGQVMKEVMNRYRGRVDGKTVQALVLKKLS